MNILFAGSSTFSIPILESLIAHKQVSAVLTTPDRPAGRGMKITSTPVKQLATTHNIPILQPERLRGEFISKLRAMNFDVLICAAYGKIFGPTFLSLFNRGTVNVHPSLLPRFRGAAPIPAAILAGDKCTGVSLQKIAVQMDCGDILLQSEYELQTDDQTALLIKRLSQQSVELVQQLLSDFDVIYKKAKVQDENTAVYCMKIESSFGIVQWWESAQQIERMTRALSAPYSGVKIPYGNGVLKVWEAKVYSQNEIKAEVGAVLGVDEEHGILIQCKRGILGVLVLQLPSKKKLFWKDFIQGNKNFLSTKLRYT